MKRVFFAGLALSLFSVNFVTAQDKPKSEEFKRWQVRVRGIGVIPN
jgi:outer membrane protein